MTLLDHFVRVKRGRPCPCCGRSKFCLLDKADPANPARVICTKIESAKKWGEAGWLHVLRDEAQRETRTPRIRRVPCRGAEGSLVESLADLARVSCLAITRPLIERFAEEMSLDCESLHRLDIGWADHLILEKYDTTCRGSGCLTFPMTDAGLSVVGIRLRTLDGFKYAVKGGRQGLFIPSDLGIGQRLFIAEGPTDTAALLGLGYEAVGRPSCDTGARLLVELVRLRQTKEVVIVGDGDEPGRRGAWSLAATLRAYAKDVRVIRPPEGIKDARAWKAAAGPGAKEQIELAIASATSLRTVVVSRRVGA